MALIENNNNKNNNILGDNNTGSVGDGGSLDQISKDNIKKNIGKIIPKNNRGFCKRNTFR